MDTTTPLLVQPTGFVSPFLQVDFLVVRGAVECEIPRYDPQFYYVEEPHVPRTKSACAGRGCIEWTRRLPLFPGDDVTRGRKKLLESPTLSGTKCVSETPS